ncbi:MAG: NnrS family protein [Zoogloeaceae bacterium]|nr:NnrS family protein [Rhodocyclaceae bacterium]MCP5237165.1 NnrS family protein [Zoogloeaceae bacterium]
MLIPLGEPTRRPQAPARGFALFALGFRPFYLLAATLAVVIVPLWLAAFAGHIRLPTTLPPVAWHAHEMLFGFGCAVITGFLFTAGRNWTGIDTPTGAALAALALLWLAGRVAMLVGPGGVGAAIELAFLPLVAIALGRVLVKAGSRRNYFVLVLLGALAGANLLFQLRAAGAVGGDPMQGVYLALALIITLTTVIGGRVIPMFTVNGLQGAVSIAQHTRHDTVAIALSVAALLAWALALPAGVSMPLAAAAALAQANRIVRWQPWATLRVPLLWILHLSHAWIPLGLTLLALSEAGLVPRSAAIHGLALGAMSGLILGMITRTALGHTGRLLQAGPVETAAYVALHLAVLARVLPLLFAPHHTMAGLMVAALGWCLAFGLYLLRYGPMLVRVRADGKPG